MMTSYQLDLTEIPLSALKQSTLVTLSASLNQHKVIPTSDGLPRDWRGLVQLMNISGVEANQISIASDHFSTLVGICGTRSNISLLLKYLDAIDRCDALDDARELIVKDSLEYQERLQSDNGSKVTVNLEIDRQILTVDDVIRLENGLEPQIYDAYILYAEEDANFANEIIDTMENKYNFKLCVRDRDLIGGVKFEHDAITKLIAERCRRLVVVVSSNFLKSKANKFFVTFAQALGIDIRERKVIPILYERCQVPPELSYYFLLDYNRAGKLWNFWEKLRDSIQTPEKSKSDSLWGNTSKSSTNSDNDLWISRIQFEKESEEVVGKQSEIPVTEIKTKRRNLCKFFKKSLNNARKVPGMRRTSEKTANIPKSETSSVDAVATINSKIGKLAHENVSNPSDIESASSHSRSDENGEKVGKKCIEKRAVKVLNS